MMKTTLALIATILMTLFGATASAQDLNSLARQMQEHADRVAINAVLVQYTTGLDQVDPDLYADTFTADARFYQGASVESAEIMADGKAAIRKIVSDLRESDAKRNAERAAEWEGEGEPPVYLRHHVMTNAVVEFIDDHTARHRAYWQTVSGSGRDMNVIAMGSYEDTLVKEDGRWLISKRYLLRR